MPSPLAPLTEAQARMAFERLRWPDGVDLGVIPGASALSRAAGMASTNARAVESS